MRSQSQSQRSNALIGAVMFLCVLASILKCSLENCFYENKLNSIFIQESQAFHVVENTFHLVRDYVHRMGTDIRTPSVLFSPESLTHDGIFNSCFSINQTVPSGFPISVTSVNIKGGPLFFLEAKQNSSDERYRSETFLISEVQVNSAFVPNWRICGVQLVELERNPLCDFQLWVEGDTSLVGVTEQTFTKPVHINGNLLCCPEGKQNFQGPVSLVGHLLHIPVESDEPKAIKPLPNEAPGRSSDEIYKSLFYTGTTRASVLFNGIDGKDEKNNSLTSLSPDFETLALECWGDALKVRQRNLRPTGFDSTLYPSYWPGSSFDDEECLLEAVAGLYGLVGSLDKDGYDLYGAGTSSGTNTAWSRKRNLTTEQVETKLKLIESQKGAAQAGTVVRIDSNLSTLELSEDDAEKFPYLPSYHLQSTHFGSLFDDNALRTYQDVV
ncbi:MAG: hypothetical protein LBR62_02085, partial [Puniceicoccales bacterium]|nr:hypothetical protein [Puniceicoccales bacterium]